MIGSLDLGEGTGMDADMDGTAAKEPSGRES